MTKNAEVYALCHCAHFDFQNLQIFLQEKERCTAYRSVLHVEWQNGHVYIFDYGIIIFWQLNGSQRNDFIGKVENYAVDPLSTLIEDDFHFETNSEKNYIKNDHIFLINNDNMSLLALSQGIAQSTKLSHFEYRIQQTINEHSHIPKSIAENGNSKLSRSDLAKLRGRLFLSKSDIMLNYDLLDTPNFFWDYPELDSYYFIVIDYLEVKQRMEVLSKKLETIHELFGMIADELRHKHSSLLEWIIIWLIAFEIVVFLTHDVFKWI
ncbi:MAG: RMD1 family protein [Gammaproteobacteria bacterium]|nr:RMD1 family protein [Gammaproteobacteria bacterium]